MLGGLLFFDSPCRCVKNVIGETDTTDRTAKRWLDITVDEEINSIPICQAVTKLL